MRNWKKFVSLALENAHLVNHPVFISNLGRTNSHNDPYTN